MKIFLNIIYKNKLTKIINNVDFKNNQKNNELIKKNFNFLNKYNFSKKELVNFTHKELVKNFYDPYKCYNKLLKNYKNYILKKDLTEKEKYIIYKNLENFPFSITNYNKFNIYKHIFKNIDKQEILDDFIKKPQLISDQTYYYILIDLLNMPNNKFKELNIKKIKDKHIDILFSIMEKINLINGNYTNLLDNFNYILKTNNIYNYNKKYYNYKNIFENNIPLNDLGLLFNINTTDIYNTIYNYKYIYNKNINIQNQVKNIFNKLKKLQRLYVSDLERTYFINYDMKLKFSKLNMVEKNNSQIIKIYHLLLDNKIINLNDLLNNDINSIYAILFPKYIKETKEENIKDIKKIINFFITDGFIKYGDYSEYIFNFLNKNKHIECFLEEKQFKNLLIELIENNETNLTKNYNIIYLMLNEKQKNIIYNLMNEGLIVRNEVFLTLKEKENINTILEVNKKEKNKFKL